MTTTPRRRRRRRAPARPSPLLVSEPTADAPSEESLAFETDIAPDLIDTRGPITRTQVVDAECHLVEKPGGVDTPD